MKKILITGFNAEQNERDYFQRKQLKILNSQYSLIRCLEDMGWQVEQRPVEQGEDLSSYDEVIVYLHSIQSFCQRLYSGLWAVAARPDCILAFDDWQIDQVFTSFSGYQKNLEEGDGNAAFRPYLVELYAGKEPVEVLKNNRNHYIESCKIINAKKNRLLICSFAGGDPTLFGLNWQGQVFTYNPNPYNLNRSPFNNYGEEVSGLAAFLDDDIVDPKDKQKQWIFSSLIQTKTQKWLKLQNPSWPILSFGAKRGEFKGERVIEPEMCRIYNRNWGCLMPEYYHAGSGWWRSRVQQVVDCKSILLCSDKEGAIYGEAFVGNTIEKIENMSLEELTQLGNRMYECLYDNHPLDKTVQRNELQRILDAR